MNPETLCMFNLAKSLNKTVLIISDMYLPQSSLQNILESKGVKGFSKIYVSSEHAKSKHSGALYKLI